MSKADIDILLPIGYDSTVLASRYLKSHVSDVKIPVADWARMEIASDKTKTMKHADSLGILTPTTYGSIDEVDKFPIVAKGRIGSGRVWYVNSPEDLPAMDPDELILQEYIPGDSYGYFGLFNRGDPRAEFMHKRLRSYPITGGASSCAIGVRDDELRDIGELLLSTLNWHGVAMAEFKKDRRDGRYRLIEMNPKFWGSLDLAISSGVDFPYLAAKMAYDGDIPCVSSYKVGVRFRWIFPYEILYLMAKPRFIGQFLLEFTQRDTSSNLDFDDPIPNFIQMIQTPFSIAGQMRKGSIVHPHGTPRGVT